MKLTKKIVGALAGFTLLFASVSTNSFAWSHEKYPTKQIEKNAGFILKETPTSKKMRLDEHEDSIIIEDVLSNSLELENWIISFGEKVEVLEPIELRDKIKQRLRAAAKKYE